MKNLLISLLFIMPGIIYGQAWMQNIPQKAADKELTLPEIQAAFNNYHDQLGVVKGKIAVEGKQVKVPGWKQFKRWEWYWESRVNPETGVFPQGKTLNEYYKQKSVKSSKSGGNWTAMGPSTSEGGYAGIGRINCVAFHPTDNNTFWIGSPSGGLWKTTDGGTTWNVLTDNNAVLGVSDIVIPSDYATSNTIYIATGDKDAGGGLSALGASYNDNNSIGVLKSTDGGQSWQASGLSYEVSQNKRMGRLMVHPSNNNILFAGTSNGISKSTDAGVSWVSVYSGEYVIDMEFKPGEPDIVYASTKDYSGKAFMLKSTNNGGTWMVEQEFSVTDYRVEIAVTPNDPEFVYALVSNQTGGLSGIYRSEDSGSAFSQLVNGDDANKSYLGYYSDGSGTNEGQGGYDLCIAASPSDKNTVLIGGVNTWKTTDAGNSWTICNMWTSGSDYNSSGAPEVHADKHSLVYRANGDLFETNDGGIYISSNNGTSWTDLSNNLVISQIYRLGVSQTNANMVINGLQDNGSKLVENSTWSDVTGGDGMECIIDYTQESTQYATYYNGVIYRTNDKWRFDFNTISDNISEDVNGAWVTPYIIDKNNNSILYVGYADVWKTTDKGNSFSKISNINSAEYLRSMAIAPSNSDVLYVADFGHIYKTSNGGSSWTEITNNLPVATNSLTYISVKNDDPQTLWVSLSGYNGKGVYQSIDGGTNWTDVSAGLPSLPIMCIVQNTQVNPTTQLYAATDIGVYLKSGTDSWVEYSNGLPNVVVTELEIYYDDTDVLKSKLRASTYGRGLWESNLSASATKAKFSASTQTVMVSDSVVFTDESTNDPTSWAWSFAGGLPDTSNIQNPKIAYNTEGTYNIQLVAINAFGTDTLLKENYITVIPLEKPIAGFLASKTEVFVAEKVQFTDTSKNVPIAWSWTFEGGTPNTSVSKNPTVSFDSIGTYAVTLVASNSMGTDTTIKTGYITVLVPPKPVAGFRASATEIYEGSSVVFTDTSKNTPTAWSWIFEGGIPATSSVQNPTLTYATNGTYNVTLVASNQTGNDSVGKTDYITVNEVMISDAQFTGNPTSGSLPLTVTFTNSSVNADTYSWDFGDETTSAEEHPVHTYNTAGTYAVTLTASNVNNSSSELKADYITVTAAEATANFTAAPQEGVIELEVTFTNNSQNASTYSWDFGDDSESSEESPVHIYTNTGVYSVSLTASNSNNSDTKVKAGYITVNYPDPIAAFSATPLAGAGPLTVFFTDMSENVEAWRWDFGDGETSNDQNPTHVYSKGTYDVSLLVTNPTGNDQLIKEAYISVDPNSLPEGLKDKLKVYPNPAKNILFVEFINENYKHVEIELFDTFGKLLKKVSPENNILVKEQIALDDLEAGNYLLRINVESHIVIMSVVKE